jgi:hypothetical protein
MNICLLIFVTVLETKNNFTRQMKEKKACQRCGKSFEAFPSQYRRYCSAKCSKTATNEDTGFSDLKICKAPKTLGEQLNNIADHKGLTFSAFMKTEMRKIVDAYPEHMRRPMEKITLD